MYVMHVASVQGVIGVHISMSLSDVDDLGRSQALASWRTTEHVPDLAGAPDDLALFLDHTIAALVKGLSSMEDSPRHPAK